MWKITPAAPFLDKNQSLIASKPGTFTPEGGSNVKSSNIATYHVVHIFRDHRMVGCCYCTMLRRRRGQAYLAPKDKFLAACRKANFESSVLIALHLQSRIHVYSTHTYKLRRPLKMNTLFWLYYRRLYNPREQESIYQAGWNIICGRSRLKYIIASCKSCRSGIEFYFWKAKRSLLLLLLPAAQQHALHHR